MRRTATHFIKAAEGTLPINSSDQGLPSRLREKDGDSLEEEKLLVCS